MSYEMDIEQADINGEFIQYKRLFLAELSRLNNTVERLEEKLEDLKAEIIMLKVKSGLWGGLAGLIPVLLAILLQLFSLSRVDKFVVPSDVKVGDIKIESQK